MCIKQVTYRVWYGFKNCYEVTEKYFGKVVSDIK